MRALDFLFLTRPILLLPVWTVYLLYYDYYLPGSPLESAVLLDLAALSLIMAAAYIINQIYDIESDRLNNKLGFFNPPVELTIRQGWLAFALLNCSALAYATFARMELLLPLGVIALAGILYSAPPVRAKDRPLPGLLFNALTYSLLVWWVLTSVRFSTAPGAPGAPGVTLVGAVFCAIAAVYVMTTLPDIEGDRRTGKHTLGAVIGIRWTAALGGVLVLCSLILAYFSAFTAVAITAAISLPLYLLTIVRPSLRNILLSAKLPILVLTLQAAWGRPGYALFCIALIALSRFYFRRRMGISYPELI